MGLDKSIIRCELSKRLTAPLAVDSGQWTVDSEVREVEGEKCSERRKERREEEKG